MPAIDIALSSLQLSTVTGGKTAARREPTAAEFCGFWGGVAGGAIGTVVGAVSTGPGALVTGAGGAALGALAGAGMCKAFEFAYKNPELFT